MTKPIFSTFTKDDDEILTLARVYDKYTACSTKNILQSTTFLSDREQALAMAMLDSEKIQYIRFGGYENADRAMLFFLPDYIDAENLPYICTDIVFIKLVPDPGSVKFNSKRTLSHRDYLGSVLALGIERGQIGDIIVTEECAFIAASPSAADLIRNALPGVGRHPVSIYPADMSDIAQIEQKFEEKTVTVASLRIDCLISGAYNISRSVTEKLIAGGSVTADHKLTVNADCKVSKGSKISVKTYGKFELSEISGTSKKGRTFVNLKIYK
ncbi:MAG: hypothetical protein E7623_06825 [Ruminococcaceae bacterium]|nr:hypothetical protein [Oscillospiraceae bacterium]